MALVLVPVLASCSAVKSVDSNSSSPTPISTFSKSPSPASSLTDSNSMFSSCDPAGLVIDWGQTEGAAGTEYRKITFKNISGTSCEVRNLPSVKLLDSVDGSALGEVGIQDGHGNLGFPVSLPTGRTLDLSIGTSNPDNYDVQECKAKSSNAILLDPHDATGFTFILNLPNNEKSWKFCTKEGNTPFFASFELEK